MTELTPDIVGTYIMIIKLNFENAYIATKEEDKLLLVASWYEALKDYPKEICDIALSNVLKHSKFAPRLGDITEEIEKLLNSNFKSDEELWAELSDKLSEVYDVSRYLPYPQHYDKAAKDLDGIYASLSEDIKLYVVNVSSLIEISELPAENLVYEKARFFRQMPVLRAHAKDKHSAQILLDKIKVTPALPDGKNNKG